MKKLLINAREPDQVRVAILDADGKIEDIDIESAGQTTYKGNIYKAQVIRIEPSLGAAFVDFGAPRNGFLPLDEVGSAMLAAITPKGRKKAKAPAAGHLERGQEVLVQVTREPMGTKGAALTTYVALPGRYLVYLPGGDRGGISRKIESAEERSKLAGVLDAIRGKKSVGLILRTAGQDRTKTELKKDFGFLDKLWKDVLKAYGDRQGPGLVWREQGAVIRAVRDYYSDEIGEVWVDEAETYGDVLRFFELTLPQGAASRVHPYRDGEPLFARYGVEEQIARARQRRVELPSGGSIVIDPTEALVAIDVNSGKLRGEKNIEETALRTNCEAAWEMARQLRLRNLGGIVVIDFIDMRDRRKRTEVERVLKEALKSDKANITLGKIGRFGTLEMLRQRLRTSGAAPGLVTCPACGGAGKVAGAPAAAPSPEAPAAVEPPSRPVSEGAGPGSANFREVAPPARAPESPRSVEGSPPSGPPPTGPGTRPGEGLQGGKGGGRRRRRRRGRRRPWRDSGAPQGAAPAGPRPEEPRRPPQPAPPEPRPESRRETPPEIPSDVALRQWSQQLEGAGQFSRESFGPRDGPPKEQHGRPRTGRSGRGRDFSGGRRGGGGGRSGAPPDDIGNRR